MKIHDARPKSYAAFWAARFAFFSLFLCMASFILYFFTWIDDKGFLALLLMVIFSAFLALILSLIGFFSLWRIGAYGGRKALRAFLLSLVILLPFGHQWLKSYYYPPYYDVATDNINPPPLALAERPLDSLPVDKSTILDPLLQKKYWPNLHNRRYLGTADQILPFVKNILLEKGWVILNEDKLNIHSKTEIFVAEKKDKKKSKTKDNKAKKTKNTEMKKIDTKVINNEIIIHALAKPFPFCMPSDIVIRLKTEKDSCLVDMRATSRYFDKDSDKNARLIQNFMKNLDEQIFLKQNMGHLYMQK